MDTGLFSGNGQILTRTAERDDIDRLDLVAFNVCNASEMFHVRKPNGRDRNGERFDFAGPHRFDPVHRSGKWESTRTVKKTS